MYDKAMKKRTDYQFFCKGLQRNCTFKLVTGHRMLVFLLVFNLYMYIIYMYVAEFFQFCFL